MSFLYKKTFVNDTRAGLPDANAWLKADGVAAGVAKRKEELLHGETPPDPPTGQWYRNELYAHPVAVDSAFRDATLYPNANDFTYSFKSIRNVKHIKLLQTELPNTSQVINRYNNSICWRNLEDVTRKVGIIADCPLAVVVGGLRIRITVAHRFTVGTTHTVVLVNSNPAKFDGQRRITVDNAQSISFKYTLGFSMLPSGPKTTVDLGPPLYTVSLDPGNYQNNIQSVAAQMSLQMNLVRRLGGVGPFHLFQITANPNTNIISCFNIDPVQVATNGLASEVNTGNITVTLANHGFFPGSTPIMIGVTPFAGFATDTLNGNIVVAATTPNTFTYVVNTLASGSVVGGGDKIKVGTGLSFKFFFAPETLYTIESVLGFPPENSSTPDNLSPLIGVTYPLIAMTPLSATMTRVTTSAGHLLVSSTRLAFTAYTGGTIVFPAPHGISENISAFVHTTKFHGEYTLVPITTTDLSIEGAVYDIPQVTGSTPGYIIFGGDKIRFFNVDIHPKPERGEMRGYFFVEAATSTTFDIEYTLNSITNISGGYIGTPFLKMGLKDHGFNEITKIEVSSANRALVTTKIPHGLVGAIYELVPIVSSATPGFLTLTIPTIAFVDQSAIDITFASTTPALVGRYIGVMNNAGNIVIRFAADTGSINEAVTVGYGSKTYIADTNSVPRLQGSYNVNTAGITNTSQFQVATTSNVTITGTKGILDISNELTLYRMTSGVGGIPLSSFNGQPHRIRVVDKDTILIVFPNETTTIIMNDPQIFPGITLYSLMRNPESLQGNTMSFRVTDSIYKKVDLSGDNYIYLRIQGIGTVITNNALSDIFCKLQLTMPPDNHIFNSFPRGDTTVQRDFSTPLTDLNQLRFELITKTGVPYDMGNMNWSFTFEVTELQQFLVSSEKNAHLIEEV